MEDCGVLTLINCGRHVALWAYLRGASCCGAGSTASQAAAGQWSGAKRIGQRNAERRRKRRQPIWQAYLEAAMGTVSVGGGLAGGLTGRALWGHTGQSAVECLAKGGRM